MTRPFFLAEGYRENAVAAWGSRPPYANGKSYIRCSECHRSATAHPMGCLLHGSVVPHIVIHPDHGERYADWLKAEGWGVPDLDGFYMVVTA